jgi:nicotinamidase-related amidase
VSVATQLLDRADSVLIVVDVQDTFLVKLDPSVAKALVARIRWLVLVAKWLKIPIIVTAEEIEADGHTTSGIREVLPIGTTEFDKWTFGLAAQADILSAVQATEKRTAVLAGLEADVCVQHSAFGLIALGYRVAVVVDATAAKGDGYEIGLGRMAGAGVARVSCKSLLFEWLRDLDSTHDFFRNSGIKAPEGLDL